MNILAVIPARGGSKGIPKKNIYPLHGRPLLCYTIEAAIKSEVVMDIAVSTDADDIAIVAMQYPQVTVVKRPDDISGDHATTEEVLNHAIRYMEEKNGAHYDAVMNLQPVSPLRKPETIKLFVEQYEKNINMYDAQLTLHEDRTDFWVQEENGRYHRLYPNAPRRRQERKPLYAEDSCIYIIKTQSLIETGSILGKKINGFVISPEEGTDINEYVDLTTAEALMNKAGNQS